MKRAVTRADLKKVAVLRSETYYEARVAASQCRWPGRPTRRARRCTVPAAECPLCPVCLLLSFAQNKPAGRFVASFKKQYVDLEVRSLLLRTARNAVVTLVASDAAGEECIATLDIRPSGCAEGWSDGMPEVRWCCDTVLGDMSNPSAVLSGRQQMGGAGPMPLCCLWAPWLCRAMPTAHCCRM